MATVTIERSEPVYVLRLSEKEAKMVRALTSMISFAESSPEISSIRRELNTAGINALGYEVGLSGCLTFDKNNIRSRD
jgi:hypothetical protein